MSFDELQILPALSRQHDQVIELHPDEANALLHSLKFYLRYLVGKATRAPLYPAETQSLRPAHRVLMRLSKLLAGSWPRDRSGRPRPRKLRLEFDVLLLLNGLLRDGTTLFAMEAQHEVPMNNVWLKINQKAFNLDQFFQL